MRDNKDKQNTRPLKSKTVKRLNFGKNQAKHQSGGKRKRMEKVEETIDVSEVEGSDEEIFLNKTSAAFTEDGDEVIFEI